METPSTLTVDGITYNVLTARPFEVEIDGAQVQRVSYTVKRPRGRRTYVVFKYENGTMSTVTPWGLA